MRRPRSGNENRNRRAKSLKRLAGAPGIEPGNGGIKIRCLTAWLRPNRDCLLRVTPWGFKARKPEPDRRTRSERLGECSHVRALRSIEGHLVGDGDARCNARFEERDVQRGSPPKHRDRLEATASSALHLGRGGLPSAGALVIHSCPQPSIASRGWFDTPWAQCRWEAATSCWKAERRPGSWRKANTGDRHGVGGVHVSFRAR